MTPLHTHLWVLNSPLAQWYTALFPPVHVQVSPLHTYLDSSPSNGHWPQTGTKRWGDVRDPRFGDVHHYNYSWVPQQIRALSKINYLLCPTAHTATERFLSVAYACACAHALNTKVPFCA